MKKLALGTLAIALLAGCGTTNGLTSVTTNTYSMAADSKVDPQAKAMLTQLDTNKDGKLSLVEFQQLGIFGVNGVGGGPSNPNPSLAELQEMTFKLLDRNQDGKLSSSEFNAFGVALAKNLYYSSPKAFYTAVFPRLDTNHDGKLTLEECKQLGMWGAVAPGSAPANATFEERQELFFQANGGADDGFITLAELAR